MKTITLIDGYNIIHSSRFLKKLLKEDVRKAQEELIRLVDSYSFLKKQKTFLVFDAYRNSFLNKEEKVSSYLRVILTGEKETADSYIERFVSQNRSYYDYIYVVTSDYVEGMTVMDERVILLSPWIFLKRLQTSKHNLENNYLSISPNSSLKFFHYLKKRVKEELKNNER